MKRSLIMRVTLLFTMTWLLASAANAQQLLPDDKVLVFEEEEHDFGLIKEADGPAEYEFKFTNKGTKPIRILNVRASCGCTTPAWTREPVAPGQEGFIKAVYNPLNRPGPFHKTLTITTDASQTPIILRIKGVVEPKPRTIEDDFPVVYGGLRVKYRGFNMGKIYNNAPTSRTFEVYNQLDRPLTFSEEYEAPEYITVKFDSATIAPKTKGRIIVTYDGAKRNDLGFMSDNIVLFTDEPGGLGRKSFNVYATLYEYFPPMSAEEAAKAPHLVINERLYDFGKVKQGDKLTKTFVLKNEGMSPLEIRKIHSSCPCVQARMETMTIGPGKSGELQVVFDTTGRRGMQQKSITIYSNDPRGSVQRITVKTVIEVPANN